MSALDLIRARDLCGMGTPATLAAADRRELLARLDKAIAAFEDIAIHSESQFDQGLARKALQELRK